MKPMTSQFKRFVISKVSNLNISFLCWTCGQAKLKTPQKCAFSWLVEIIYLYLQHNYGRTGTLPRCLISFTERFDTPWQIYGRHVMYIFARDKCISIYLVNKGLIVTINSHCSCVRRMFHYWFWFYTIAFGSLLSTKNI